MTITTTDLLALCQTEPSFKTRLGQRNASHIWEVGEGEDHYGHACMVNLTLTTSHDKDRKRFFSHARIEKVRDGIASLDLMNFVSVSHQACARYSDKNLVAAAEVALSALRARDSIDLKQ